SNRLSISSLILIFPKLRNQALLQKSLNLMALGVNY
ncbi:hypothetical protein ACSSV5_002426, partial [Psychroflexus sp. MBR-150]